MIMTTRKIIISISFILLINISCYFISEGFKFVFFFHNLKIIVLMIMVMVVIIIVLMEVRPQCQ